MTDNDAKPDQMSPALSVLRRTVPSVSAGERVVASDDSAPYRRIMFGTIEEAESFVKGIAGWSVITESDGRWLSLIGVPGGPTTEEQSRSPSERTAAH